MEEREEAQKLIRKIENIAQYGLTLEERKKAINLLGEIGPMAAISLLDIAQQGLTSEERTFAMEKIEEMIGQAKARGERLPPDLRRRLLGQ